MNDYKPIFHITGEKGWINDPNGFSFFQGKYHIFFQHHPYSNVWGPMHWGHVVSSDLLHFEYLPIALTPGDPYDKNGCFSGSALVKDDTLYLVYTGFILVPENEEHNQQIQCLASSKDGIHFEKHGVIISSEQLPSGYKTTDFRDPKVFEKDGTFYLLACSRKKEGHGSILLFRSQDLKNWEFLNDILTHDSEGEMIECVDYDKDLNLLLYSEQNFPSESEHCLNVHACEYEVGQFDSSWKFISQGEKTLLDYGFDFYAAQMLNDGKYLIAWLDMWGRNNPTAEHGFAGMLTVPRKITLEDGVLLQTPVIYGKLSEEQTIQNHYEGRLSVGTIVLDIEDLNALSLELRKGEGEVTKFYLENDMFYFDRSQSGIPVIGDEKDPYSLKGLRKMPYRKKEKDQIILVLDRYSIEIFVNGISMSNTVYPKDSSDRFEINVDAKNASIKIYK